MVAMGTYYSSNNNSSFIGNPVRNNHLCIKKKKVKEKKVTGNMLLRTLEFRYESPKNTQKIMNNIHPSSINIIYEFNNASVIIKKHNFWRRGPISQLWNKLGH